MLSANVQLENPVLRDTINEPAGTPVHFSDKEISWISKPQWMYYAKVGEEAEESGVAS